MVIFHSYVSLVLPGGNRVGCQFFKQHQIHRHWPRPAETTSSQGAHTAIALLILRIAKVIQISQDLLHQMTCQVLKSDGLKDLKAWEVFVKFCDLRVTAEDGQWGRTSAPPKRKHVWDSIVKMEVQHLRLGMARFCEGFGHLIRMN